MAARRKSVSQADSIRNLRKTVVTALFSDDELLRRLALKGGGALDLAYGIGARASLDLDFSIEGDFEEDLGSLEKRFQSLLVRQFSASGIHVFDLRLEEKPPRISPELEDFWGGYSLSFKLIENEKLQLFQGNLEQLRRNAMMASVAGSTTLQIDISRHECLDSVSRIDIDGYQASVYTPMAIVFEKLRAICQQMPEYGPIVLRQRGGAPRARDFFDITMILKHHTAADLTAPESLALLRRFFEVKHVPLNFLARIGDESVRMFHASDWDRVRANATEPAKLHPFDHYFNQTAELARRLCEALGIPYAPAG